MAKVCGARAIKLCSIFVIIINISCCVTAEFLEREKYYVYSDLPHADSASIIKLREKRQTPTDLKNKYQSVSQNASESHTLPPQPITPQNLLNASLGDGTQLNVTDSSMVIPYNVSDRPLLGVNGTGQLKDTTLNKLGGKATVVSDPIQTQTNVSSKYPKKALGIAAVGANVADGVVSGAVVAPPETPEEEVVDKIDVPEDETINALKQRNYTTDQTDYHNYYNSTIYVDKVQADEIWRVIKNITHNSMLSQSHRRAMTVELSFEFPFYGYPVRNITVATGGFLYTGEYVHSWLAATQYIAPLMANFDTSLGNNSFVRLSDNGTAFTVIWENVSLQDKPDVGKFTFSTTLHKNGDIVFTYFQVPILIHAIQDDKHPVKVGLSDAYIIDKIVYFARRKTIYEYHRVNFASFDITNSTIIYLKALPTCLEYNDCVSCVNHDTTFDCAWCPILNRCSTGTDRKKQEWLNKGCDRTQISNVTACPALGERGNNADKNKTTGTPSTNTNQSNTNESTGSPHQLHPSENDKSSGLTPNSQSLNKASMVDSHEHSEPKSVGLAFGLLAPLCLIATFLLWVLYAYRNPHTKSGQLLIQYRPSTWSWRRGEARYTAATIHM